jgi:hypothetical protein
MPPNGWQDGGKRGDTTYQVLNRPFRLHRRRQRTFYLAPHVKKKPADAAMLF